MSDAKFLSSQVSDPTAAARFLERLDREHPSDSRLLRKDPALLSDILVLVSFSPLFATTLLQDPGYIGWLRRERLDSRVRDKNTLLESLARFSMTHSALPANVILARYRRRELMRIFLRDVRRLSTIAEVTEEISNLADAVLEHALRLAKQEMDNRFGPAQAEDDRHRLRPARYCIVSLGKLGSRELNYSSDIDLLFMFSDAGFTSGSGTHEAISNLEYYSKLTQAVIKLVGGQGGEGAAYRVDLRLRPHGRVGPLAMTIDDTVRYYRVEAAAWERQVLIRARASAGAEELYRKFLRSVEDTVFSPDVSVATALANVALSKQKIDLQSVAAKGTDIKLGPGGIREIEFIAQSLQLAYGGRDKWLRVPHTLVSLDRLTQRGHLAPKELSDLFAAYDFFRHLEHILQIENGLQTHLVPHDIKKRFSIAQRVGLELAEFDSIVENHKENVRRVFERVFGGNAAVSAQPDAVGEPAEIRDPDHELINILKDRAPRFSPILDAHPDAVRAIPDLESAFPDHDYLTLLRSTAKAAGSFGNKLRELRRCWYRMLIEIVAFDAMGKLELRECKHIQSRLAEASINVALEIAQGEIEKRYKMEIESFPLAVLALGKLGSGSLDYDSDLDLIMVFDPRKRPARQYGHLSEQELLTRVVEVFTNVLSSVTRDGSLYRVDLRLRPHGSDGPPVISREAIINYFRETAAVWELLAYVNLRAVGGDLELGASIEKELRSTIHERAFTIDPAVLAAETRAVRDKLEKQKALKRTGEIDIKYGPGGLLDVYFAVRFLQLRNGVLGAGPERSTELLLETLAGTGASSVGSDHLEVLLDAYQFLTGLDHRVRMTFGRSSVFREAGPHDDHETRLREHLATTLISVRDAYDHILATTGKVVA